MLTPEQVDGLRVYASRMTDPLNDFLLKDIVRRIKEAAQLTSTAQYQIWRMQQMGVSQRQIKKRLRELLKVSHRELRQLLTQSAEVGYSFDIKNLPYVQAPPFAQNLAMQQIVQAAVDLAEADFTNITQTLGMVDPFGRAMPLQEAYRSVTDFAFNQVSTGATDYNTAVRRASANIAKYGIRTIDYESGVHTSLEAAVRRNIMGGLGLMQERISQYNHDALGADGWELSAHAASAPDHEPYQGQQFADAEYIELNNSLQRRIGTLNCGHAAFPIILGVSQPQYTEEQLQKLKDDNADGVTVDGKHYTSYEATQQQRAIERAIRAQKRKVTLSPDDEKDVQSAKLTRLQQEYKRFSNKAGLRTEDERLHVSGWGRKEATAATQAAKRFDLGRQTEYNRVISEARQAIADNPKTIVVGQQNKHIVGTHEYEQKVAQLQARGQNGPSRFNGTLEDAKAILERCAGKGEPDVKGGKWRNAELILLDTDQWGTVINNIDGMEKKTRMFKIHYRKTGAHIVPDYPSKEERLK